ncbi:MAG TPA: PqqD family protein [Thermodesulfobacteriota bacterium]|nr:PqqD family protein [Thermodesulfobacteriota bacterium]
MMEDIKDLYAKRNEGDIVWNRVGKKIIIIMTREKDEKILRPNTTAGFIWESCDGKRTVQDVVNDLCLKYEVEKTKALGETVKLLNQMEKIQLITFSPDPS